MGSEVNGQRCPAVEQRNVLDPPELLGKEDNGAGKFISSGARQS